MSVNNFNWDCSAFFERLTKNNKLAIDNDYRFVLVSSLEGFHSALSQMLSASAFVAVSETSQGTLTIDNSPHTRRVKTVFLAKRFPMDDADGAHREAAMTEMRELFRQFMSVLVQEKTRLEESCIYLDDRISFNEIDRYFFTGCACAYFQMSIDTYTNLAYNQAEWLNNPNNQ